MSDRFLQRLGWNVGCRVAVLLILCCWGGGGLRLMAHVGSPYVVFEGKAGQFPIRAVVRQPEVVPGLAEIHVRVEPEAGQSMPRRVTVLPLHATTDRKGAPRADEALLVEGETNLYRAELWFMARGAYGVEIGVEGERGGTVMVPVNSLATARKPMPGWLGWVLGGLGLVLAVGVVLIAAAAIREATVAGDAIPEPGRARRSMLGGGVALVLVVMSIYWGGRWWGYEENVHASRVVFKPFEHVVRVVEENGRRGLELELTDARVTQRNYGLVQDHGKWVHLFLVGEEKIPTLVHLHPVRQTPRLYRAQLPPLRPGTYRVFGELTHETGLSQTLTNRITVTGGRDGGASEVGWEWSDRADSWLDGAGEVDARMRPLRMELSEGRSMQVEVRKQGRSDPALISVRVTDREGKPVVLEPYLRMMGHAMVMRMDGGVFAHLHPAGTLNMAAARKLAQRMDGEEAGRMADLICGDLEALPAEARVEWARTGEVRFPFFFPQPGSYWIWVQVSIDGKVETGRFEWNES